eukprot:2268280-Pyramimonas_sp.AAC.1
MRPERAPMQSAPNGEMKPAAGVTAARPAIEPVHMPSREDLPLFLMSCSSHTHAAVAALICEANAAKAAPAPAATADPPLNPYQPT